MLLQTLRYENERTDGRTDRDNSKTRCYQPVKRRIVKDGLPRVSALLHPAKTFHIAEYQQPRVTASHFGDAEIARPDNTRLDNAAQGSEPAA